MRILRSLLYKLQFAKYARQLPFYMVRHFGIRERYLLKEINHCLNIYGFNKRFSPIAFALFCNKDDFDKLSADFQPCPTREQIRKLVAKKYFDGKTDFDLYLLMKISQFKVEWVVSDESGIPSANNEYLRYMAKFDRKWERWYKRLAATCLFFIMFCFLWEAWEFPRRHKA